MNEKDLFEKKEEIQQRKSELSEENGQLKTLLEELKNRWGFASLDEARKKYNELVEEKQEKDEMIEKGLSKLEEKLEEE